VCGEVDSVTAPVLRDCLLDVFGRPSPPVAVVLDLSQVSFLSAAGLTALAIAHREADLAGLGLGIRCGTARAVIRPLVITGLWNVFPIV
jgi:anti-sigma B factor antagonist